MLKELGKRKENYVLHVCTLEKFIPDFIDFVRKEFPRSNNRFLVVGDIKRFPYTAGKDCQHFDGWLSAAPAIIWGLINAKKVVVHGLFSKFLIFYLVLFCPLLKKCYWIIWGGDLYQYRSRKKNLRNRLKELFRRIVIKRFGFLVAFIPGDIELARSWYKAGGKHISCFTYLSNVVSADVSEIKECRDPKILIGNSADPENRHIEIFQAISKKKFIDNITNIIVPLSYGSKDYAKNVINSGESLFGDKFLAITDFMQKQDYLCLLSECDIAVFGHKRQQAIGNTVSLLGLGKKVYLFKGTVQWDFFIQHDIKVYDLDCIELSRIAPSVAKRNSDIVKSLFSRERLASDLMPLVTI